ncbi:two-component regulator propeller domain-containing protein [Limibacter armeniacum]|uniref:type IX secretion system anionic LPS delivery protein PorZ n=1 Tax=Limibacter armeniacum TaxID=466084 RepID=UPI002FE641AC
MKILLGTLFFLSSLCAMGQDIPVGSWRTHLTYHNTHIVEFGENKVYAASANGLFFLDLETNELQPITKVDGLSDSDVGALSYRAANGQLLIAYRNGNIDVLEQDGIVNIRTILNADYPDKTLYDAENVGMFTYISSEFGIVRLDMDTYNIRDTYAEIGIDGEQVAVYDLQVIRDTIFAATAEGLKAAPIDESVNKQDFRNWTLLRSSNSIRKVAGGDDKVYFWEETSGVWEYAADTALLITDTELSSINGIAYGDEALLVLRNEQIEKIGSEVTTLEGSQIVSPQDATFGDDGTLWVADKATGLTTLGDDITESFFPSGTYAPEVYRLFYFEDRIVAVRGGYANGSAQGLPASFYLFEEGKWTNFTAESNNVGAVNLPDINDLTGFVYNPFDGKGYFTSYGGGLLVWNIEENTFEVIKSGFEQDTQGNVNLHSIVVDGVGDLWMGANRNVYTLPLNGTVNKIAVNGLTSPLDMAIDDFAQLWFRKSTGGLLVYQNGVSRSLSEGSNNGGLPSQTVLSLSNDREGSIWVGTAEGVAEFFSPSTALSSSPEDAVLPRFEGRPILQEDQVTAIAVDGGNRKWLGTNNGLWLFGPDGSSMIQQFTAENSPLLSNRITSLVVHPKTGEVFIGTDKGLVSYRSDATVASQQHADVKVFPNPVRPNYSGVVSISGLAEDVEVKITDISGELVWETQAAGGTATWNIRDYNGKRVKTGVYLIFSSSEDGEETFVTKVAVVE